MAIEVEIQWQGTNDQKAVASTVYALLTARARFFADDAPIRQSLANLLDFFEKQHPVELQTKPKNYESLIEKSLTLNDHVFARVEEEGSVLFVTTKRGTLPSSNHEDLAAHSFKSRLFEGAHEPDEAELKAVRGATREMPDIIMAYPETVHPVFPIDIPDVFEPDEEPVLADSAERVVAEDQPVAALVDRRIRIGDTVIDLSEEANAIAQEHAGAFKEMLGKYLDEDFRFVRFGEQYYVEDRLERLSKGQLRDIKDFINERGEPLADEELIAEALRRPLQGADVSLWRFTINYRLARERKDFRFVGTAEDRRWATTSLPPVGQSFRKPSEIAQDYRYLTDPELADGDPVTPASGADASGRLQIRHVLTWYESENGVLPVSPATQLMMPTPLLDDQPVVILRIQDPQNFATHTAELRLGVGNRGTHIAGLEELFQSTLVPGAIFTLVQGASSNEYTIEYERQSAAQESRLLQWDERRERWFFGPVVYECPVDPSYLLSEERIGELNGRKRASDAERKRPDHLLQLAFELVGERGTDGSLTALVDDLTPVMNIDRPFSRSYVESVVESGQYPKFTLEDPSIGLAAYRA
ncbi:MAG: hypothetical protein M3506_03030 [Chloroflexota bacterium]|nr:hypothetical protein [Chloroflexota bacterium]